LILNVAQKNATLEVGMQHVLLAGLAAVVIELAILLIVQTLLRRSGKDFGLRDFLKEWDGYYSLSNFQFFSWTMVVVFTFVTVSWIRIQLGVLEAPAVSGRLLILMGISSVSALAGKSLSQTMYKEGNQGGGGNPAGNPGNSKSFWKVLTEDDRPELTRYQMFTWTIIAIFIYLFSLVSVLNGLIQGGPFTAEELKVALFLPDVDPTMVGLMGLSQLGYVGGKTVKKLKSDSEEEEKAKTTTQEKAMKDAMASVEVKVEGVVKAMEAKADEILRSVAETIKEEVNKIKPKTEDQ